MVTQPGDVVEPPRGLRAERVVVGVAQVLAHDLDVGGVGAPHGHVPEADALDVVGGEPVQPVVGLGPALGGTGVDVGVTQPGADVEGRVGDVPLHEPRIDTGRQPGPDTVGPVLAGAVHPGGKQLPDPTLGEITRQLPNDHRARPIAREAGVAVGVVHPSRPDDERRVADDLVEPPPGDGREPLALAQLDVDLVEPERGPGQGERAGGEVSGGDRLRVGAGVEGLDATAGAEVEQAPDRPPRGRPGEVDGGMADTQHVIGGHGPTTQVGIEVGDDPPALLVRPDVQPGPPFRRDHGRRDRVVEAHRPERRGDRGLGLGVPQQEQADQRAKCAGVPRGPAGRLGLTTPERGMRLHTQHVDDTVRGVSDGQERVPQAGAQVSGEIRNHVRMLSRPPRARPTRRPPAPASRCGTAGRARRSSPAASPSSASVASGPASWPSPSGRAP